MNRLVWFVMMALLLPAAAGAQPTVPTPMSFPVDAGERVIVEGAQKVRNGMLVKAGN